MFLRKTILISIFSTLCGAAAMDQTYNLKGRVLDKAGMKPVAGATVQVSGASLKATTDSQGRFTLEGATGIGGVRGAFMAAPYFQGGILYVQAVKTGQRAGVELFGLAGALVSASEYVLKNEGWNRFDALPGRAGDFHGFARITTGGETYVRRILNLDVPAGLQWSGEASSHASGAVRGLAKAAAGNLEVSADRLVKKTVAFAAEDADLGDIVLDYPPRRLDVGAPPVYGAYTLFDGSKGKAAAQAELKAKWKDWIPAVTGAELQKYTAARDQFKIAKDPEFPDDTNRVTLMSCCNTLWGYDDIQALQTHADAQIHVEFNGMGEYDNAENANANDAIDETPRKPGYYNSGVYLQSRYEVQVRAFSQNHATLPGNHDIAGLVDDYAPTVNAIRPNGKWQAYDITFRSARYDNAGKKLDDARVSIWWNGVQVHSNRVAHGTATGVDPGKHSGEELGPALYGLKLQSEGSDVRYRNIWVKDLAITDTDTNFGY
ncbi:MAG: hypothetical protein JWO30_3091 [Fibrobacteres bacterium]|nr:hypothetical protein [Fibrobacterota bacterium]